MTDARSDYLRLTDRRAGDTGWRMIVAGDCVVERGGGGAGGEGGREVGEGSVGAGRSRAGRMGPIGPDVAERVTAADLSVAGLAAPVPSGAEPVDRIGPTRLTAPRTPQLLREAGFNVAALANGHAMDYGGRGLERTIDACHGSALLTCGAGDGIEDATAPVYLTVDGTSIAVFAFCERGFGTAVDGTPGTAWISHPDARRRVAAEADRSEVVVVLAHGGVEHVPFPSPRRQARLGEFADLGADLVVGHGPRVTQGWEVYEGTPIFYSLGDFLDGTGRPESRGGLALSVEFVGATPVAVELVPTVQANGAVRELGRGSDRAGRLHRLHRLAAVTADRDALRAHWQEVAVRTFERRYADWLPAGAVDGLLEAVTRPIRSLRDGGGPPGRDRTEETRRLLALLRNESHRDVVETAIGLRAGDVEDRRTPDVSSTVDELLDRPADPPFPSGRRRSDGPT